MALSGAVAAWWESETNATTSSLPGPVKAVLNARPDTSEADVHLVLWFLAGIAAMLAVHVWRPRLIMLGALVANSAVLEVAQTLTPDRAAQWTDLAGNVLGIMAAALVVHIGELLLRRRRRRRRRNGVAAGVGR